MQNHSMHQRTEADARGSRLLLPRSMHSSCSTAQAADWQAGQGPCSVRELRVVGFSAGQ